MLLFALAPKPLILKPYAAEELQVRAPGMGIGGFRLLAFGRFQGLTVGLRV